LSPYTIRELTTANYVFYQLFDLAINSLVNSQC
jgi:hypothetical protein